MSELTWKEQDLRAAQILVFALLTGPLLFLGTVAVLSQTQTQPTQGGALDTLTVLSAVNAFMAPSSWAAAAVLFKMQTQRLRGLDPQDPARLADRILGGYRQAMILAMALSEGAGLFGVVCVFLAWHMGQLADNPVLWFNATTVLGVVAAALAVFPTEYRLRALAEAV